MKLNYSKTIFIVAVIILALVLVLDVTFTNLLLGKIFSINDKVKQLEISSQERFKEMILKDSISSSDLEREKLKSYFVGPGNAETVEFTKYLESLADEFKVTQTKSLNYGTVSGLESSASISVIKYKFNVTGKWSNVYNFLQAIENLPKVSSLDSVSLSASYEAVPSKDKKAGDQIWSADLDFSVVKLNN